MSVTQHSANVDLDSGPLLLGETRMGGDRRADLGRQVGGERGYLVAGQVDASGDSLPNRRIGVAY